jgi:hypothetical protein
MWAQRCLVAVRVEQQAHRQARSDTAVVQVDSIQQRTTSLVAVAVLLHPTSQRGQRSQRVAATQVSRHPLLHQAIHQAQVVLRTP